MVVIEDVLTFAQEKRIRVVEVKALGTRRGPASEAQELYIDRSSVEELFPKAPISDQKGRPSKKDRRAFYRLQQSGT